MSVKEGTGCEQRPGANNRSYGQRIRRSNENIGALVEGQERTNEVVAQLDRDMKVVKARLTAVEREKSRK